MKITKRQLKRIIQEAVALNQELSVEEVKASIWVWLDDNKEIFLKPKEDYEWHEWTRDQLYQVVKNDVFNGQENIEPFFDAALDGLVKDGSLAETHKWDDTYYFSRVGSSGF